VLPCADCEGIQTVVVLMDDGGYRTRATYLGKGDQTFTQQGRFAWSAAGSAITLAGDEPAQYTVGESTLTRLAMDGSRITGALASHYVLTKDAADEATRRLTNRRWKLVELNGQAVPKLMFGEPYFILTTEDAGVSGHAGCNFMFGGNHEIDTGRARIHLSNIFRHTGACDEGNGKTTTMDVENAFLQVLHEADGYALDGERLTLTRAGAPLARFEARDKAD
jgi:heat shock protein HslJ